jgi:hypothetical protein
MCILDRLIQVAGVKNGAGLIGQIGTKIPTFMVIKSDQRNETEVSNAVGGTRIGIAL